MTNETTKELSDIVSEMIDMIWDLPLTRDAELTLEDFKVYTDEKYHMHLENLAGMMVNQILKKDDKQVVTQSVMMLKLIVFSLEEYGKLKVKRT